LSAERRYIAFLYALLDVARMDAAGRLDATLLDSSARSPQTRWQRDVSVEALTARLARLRVADDGLCFGRLEDLDGGRSYVGRIGLFDKAAEHAPLLIDWRAPAARPFYTATGAHPEGVSVRRHFHTRGRQIEDFHDEVLDLAAADTGRDPDAGLLAALNAPRESTMRDIVATIQAEQDEIIRLGHAGVVVIEGGPGTGKTAVAMHRVAYLLYTERERLSRRGVLMIGPSPRFLRYIGNVLPSLGETDVVFATPGELLPGVRTAAEDGPHARRVKGSGAMLEVLAAAVADRQGLPEAPIEIALHDGPVPLDRELAAAARQAAQASGLPHNGARRVFRDRLVETLAARAVDRIAAGWLRPAAAGELAACWSRTCGTIWPPARSWPPRWNCSGRCSPRSGCWPGCSAAGPGSRPPPPCWTRPTGRRCCAPAVTPGRSPTCRCWTRPPNCSARWTPTPRGGWPGWNGRSGRRTPAACCRCWIWTPRSWTRSSAPST
jgi:hypothetical protein